MKIVNTQRVGSIFVRNFDQGVVDALKPRVGTYVDAEGTSRKGYLVDIKNVATDIPLIMSQPEPEFETSVIPSIVVRREDPSFAANRWHSLADAYRYGFEMSPGKRRVEIRSVDWPHDMNYTIEVLARLKGQANEMLRYVLRIFKPLGKIWVLDELGKSRSYEAFMEGIANIDELTDEEDKHSGFAITVRIEGELTLDDEFDDPAAGDTPPIVNVGGN